LRFRVTASASAGALLTLPSDEGEH
jgi:hypothetical protein